MATYPYFIGYTGISHSFTVKYRRDSGKFLRYQICQLCLYTLNRRMGVKGHSDIDVGCRFGVHLSIFNFQQFLNLLFEISRQKILTLYSLLSKSLPSCKIYDYCAFRFVESCSSALLIKSIICPIIQRRFFFDNSL